MDFSSMCTWPFEEVTTCSSAKGRNLCSIATGLHPLFGDFWRVKRGCILISFQFFDKLGRNFVNSLLNRWGWLSPPACVKSFIVLTSWRCSQLSWLRAHICPYGSSTAAEMLIKHTFLSCTKLKPVLNFIPHYSPSDSQQNATSTTFGTNSSAKKHRVNQRYLRYNTLCTPHTATHRTAGRLSSRLRVDLSASGTETPPIAQGAARAQVNQRFLVVK